TWFNVCMMSEKVTMKRLALCIFPVLLFSCKTNINLFGSKNLHEQYGRKLKDAGLKETALGRSWFTAADKALSNPQAVSLPYKEIGYFATDKPRAVGIKFNAKRGEKLQFTFSKNPTTGFNIYADLWRVNDQNAPSLITSVDTSKTSFEHEVNRDETYILRLQPELLRSGEYTLSISVGPTLAFPVADKSAKIGSFWGAARDAGARSHEGIDIFAPRGTPAVAAADGIVTSVSENNLGGKVVFMRPSGKDYNLYYAHLHEQLVTNGQTVKQGEKLGTVGNTGNARTTSPHLHFGIYTMGGAIDPLPFVNPVIRKPADVNMDPKRLLAEMRLKSDVRIGDQLLKSNTLVFPLSATAKDIRLQLPDGRVADIETSNIQTSASVIKQATTKDNVYIKEAPATLAPRITSLAASSSVNVLGYFNAFAFVNTSEGSRGWIESSALR
ncbi:MAG TPA: M23 family metallopeptidase, partial [Flavisolibacter sp.]|nr:M23 family metallopeptidase [Flavisolibacter sp.]